MVNLKMKEGGSTTDHVTPVFQNGLDLYLSWDKDGALGKTLCDDVAHGCPHRGIE